MDVDMDMWTYGSPLVRSGRKRFILVFSLVVGLLFRLVQMDSRFRSFRGPKVIVY